MKKNYQKPAIQVETINAQQPLLGESIQNVAGGTLKYGGASSNNYDGEARGRSCNDWDDEE